MVRRPTRLNRGAHRLYLRCLEAISCSVSNMISPRSSLARATIVAVAALFLAAGHADARAGRGGGFGSRGSRTCRRRRRPGPRRSRRSRSSARPRRNRARVSASRTQSRHGAAGATRLVLRPRRLLRRPARRRPARHAVRLRHVRWPGRSWLDPGPAVAGRARGAAGPVRDRLVPAPQPAGLRRCGTHPASPS